MVPLTAFQNFFLHLLLNVVFASLGFFGKTLAHDTDFLKKATPGARVVVFDKIAIPVIKGDRIIAYLRFTVHLQAKTELLFSKLEKIQPVLNDAIYTDLYGAMSDSWIEDKIPQIESIQYRVQKIVSRWFPEKGEITTHIRELFLQKIPKDRLWK